MPEARWLLCVSPTAIAKLDEDPDEVDNLRDKHQLHTYCPSTIAYFTTGKPSCIALAGVDELECSTVVDGVLGLVRPKGVAAILASLEKLDLDAIATQVAAAKPKPLAKQGVDDFDLVDMETPATFVVSEIEGLIRFYRRVAKKKYGVVMYTS